MIEPIIQAYYFGYTEIEDRKYTSFLGVEAMIIGLSQAIIGIIISKSLKANFIDFYQRGGGKI